MVPESIRGCVVGYHLPRRGGQTQPVVVFDFPPLGNGGGAVQNEGELLIRWQAYGQGVCAQHVFHAEGGGNTGSGVCAGNSYAARIRGHGCVVAGNVWVEFLTAVMPMPCSFAISMAIFMAL